MPVVMDRVAWVGVAIGFVLAVLLGLAFITLAPPEWLGLPNHGWMDRPY